MASFIFARKQHEDAAEFQRNKSQSIGGLLIVALDSPKSRPPTAPRQEPASSVPSPLPAKTKVSWRAASKLVRLANKSKTVGKPSRAPEVDSSQLARKKWQQMGSIIKATASGVSRLTKIVDKEKQSYVKAAQEAIRLAALGVGNITLTVADEVDLKGISYLQQGDASMYTPEALEQRRAVRTTPQFLEAVRLWWQWLPLYTVPPLAPGESSSMAESVMPKDIRGMTKSVYCAMAQLIQKVLLPRFGIKPDPNYDPEDDWKYDCKGQRIMLFPQFLTAMFDLADIWCPTIGTRDYANMLRDLLHECKELEAYNGSFSKLLKKYQRLKESDLEVEGRDGLAMTGGYVEQYDRSTGRSLAPGAFGEVTEATAELSDGGGSGGFDAAENMVAEDDEEVRGWWDRLMDRNKRYVEGQKRALLVSSLAEVVDTGPEWVAPPEPDSSDGEAESEDGLGELGGGRWGMAGRAPSVASSKLPATGATRESSVAYKVALNEALKRCATFSEEELKAMVCENGTLALNRIGAHTLSGVISALIKVKQFKARNLRKVLANGTYQTLDAPTLCAVRSALTANGFDMDQLSGLLASHGLGLSPNADVEVIERIAEMLAQAGFSTNHIVSFLCPPANAAVNTTARLSDVQLQAMMLALQQAGVEAGDVSKIQNWTADTKSVEQATKALESVGFTPLEVQRFIAPAAAAAVIEALQKGGLSAGAAANALRPNGEKLTLTLAPNELATAVQAMAESGFSSSQIVKVVGPDGVAFSPLDPATRKQCMSALHAAGFTEADLDTLMLPNRDAIDDDVPAETLSRVVGALVEAGCSTEVIRGFLFLSHRHRKLLPSTTIKAIQTAIAQAGLLPDAAASPVASARGSSTNSMFLEDGSGLKEEAGVKHVFLVGDLLAEQMFAPRQIKAFLEPEKKNGAAVPRTHLAARDIAVFRAVLSASGLDPQELLELLRPNGRGFDPEAEPELIARAVAALSAASFSGHDLQLFLAVRDPVTALTPAEVDAVHKALETAGFTQESMSGLLRPDGLGLTQGADAYAMAQVAAVLVQVGLTSAQLCQFLAPELPYSSLQLVSRAKSFTIPLPLDQSTLQEMNKTVSSRCGLSTAVLRKLTDVQATGASPETLLKDSAVVNKISKALQLDGYTPNQIRQFLMNEIPDPRAARSAGRSEPVDHISPALHYTILSVLRASGFTQTHIVNMMAPDGRRLDPESDPESIGKAVAALAGASFGADVIRLFLTPGPPVPALVPAESALMHEALQSDGFTDERLDKLLRKDRSRVGPGATSADLAQLAASLCRCGATAGHVLRYLGAEPAPTLATLAVSGGAGSSMALAGLGAAASPGAASPSPGSISLDIRNMEDVKLLAATCGLSSRSLGEMIRSDGLGLTPSADPRVIDRVAASLGKLGYTPGQILRFCMPHGGCGYGKLDPATGASLKASLVSCGYSQQEMKGLLRDDGIAAGNTPQVVAAMVCCLAISGAPEHLIRTFCRVPANAGAASKLNQAAVEACIQALSDCGITEEQVKGMLRKNGTGLAPAVGPMVLAQAAAAMATCGISSLQMRQFLRPLNGADPAAAAAMRSALRRAGWTEAQLEGAFTPDGNALSRELDLATLVTITEALAKAGFTAEQIRQVISITPDDEALGPGVSLGAISSAAFFISAASSAAAATASGQSAAASPRAPAAAPGAGSAGPSPLSVAASGPASAAAAATQSSASPSPAPATASPNPFGSPAAFARIQAALGSNGGASAAGAGRGEADGDSRPGSAVPITAIPSLLATSVSSPFRYGWSSLSIAFGFRNAAGGAAGSGADSGAASPSPMTISTISGPSIVRSKLGINKKDAFQAPVTESPGIVFDAAAMREALLQNGFTEATLAALRMDGLGMLPSAAGGPTAGTADATRPGIVAQAISILAKGDFNSDQIRAFISQAKPADVLARQDPSQSRYRMMSDPGIARAPPKGPSLGSPLAVEGGGYGMPSGALQYRSSQLGAEPSRPRNDSSDAGLLVCATPSITTPGALPAAVQGLSLGIGGTGLSPLRPSQDRQLNAAGVNLPLHSYDRGPTATQLFPQWPEFSLQLGDEGQDQAALDAASASPAMEGRRQQLTTQQQQAAGGQAAGLGAGIGGGVGGASLLAAPNSTGYTGSKVLTTQQLLAILEGHHEGFLMGLPKGLEQQLAKYLLQLVRHLLGDSTMELGPLVGGISEAQQQRLFTELVRRLLVLARNGLGTLEPPGATITSRNGAVLALLTAVRRASPPVAGSGGSLDGMAASILRFILVRASDLKLFSEDGEVLPLPGSRQSSRPQPREQRSQSPAPQPPAAAAQEEREPLHHRLVPEPTATAAAPAVPSRQPQPPPTLVQGPPAGAATAGRTPHQPQPPMAATSAGGPAIAAVAATGRERSESPGPSPGHPYFQGVPANMPRIRVSMDGNSRPLSLDGRGDLLRPSLNGAVPPSQFVSIAAATGYAANSPTHTGSGYANTAEGLRSLPAGYARGVGSGESPRTSNSGRAGPLVYERLASPAVPSAAKFGSSPKANMAPWPLQRAFMRRPSTAGNDDGSAGGGGGSPLRLSQSGIAGSSMLPPDAVGSPKHQMVHTIFRHQAERDVTASPPLSPARQLAPTGSGRLLGRSGTSDLQRTDSGGGGGVVAMVQPRPSSSGLVDGNGKPPENKALESVKLPSLTRRSSLGNIDTATEPSSPRTQRAHSALSNVGSDDQAAHHHGQQQQPARPGSPMMMPPSPPTPFPPSAYPPEALFARLLAELLKYLGTPASEPFAPITNWRGWLSLERVRLSSQSGVVTGSSKMILKQRVVGNQQLFMPQYRSSDPGLGSAMQPQQQVRRESLLNPAGAQALTSERSLPPL